MNKPRRMRWIGYVARMGRRGLPEGERPLGRPRRRWKDSIKMNLGQIGCVMDWIDLAQDRDKWGLF
jgi:hypothetical protein